MNRENLKDDELKKCIPEGNDLRDWLDSEIHHIIKVKYFLKMLKEQSLFLQRVTEWDDPYDSAILRLPVRVNGRIMELSENVKSIYGQCWTARESECDGLWRVYSDNRKVDTVRLTTTVRTLLEALLQSPAHDEKRRDFAIGKVAYMEQEEIRGKLAFRPEKLGNAVGCGEDFLFLKRKEFSYENEVRVIYSRESKKEKKEEGVNERETKIYPVKMPFEWPEILSRVQFSPWMCPCLKGFLQKLLCETYGFRNYQVVDSKLYEPLTEPIPVEIVSQEVEEENKEAEKRNAENSEEVKKYQDTMNNDQPEAVKDSEPKLSNDEADDILNRKDRKNEN